MILGVIISSASVPFAVQNSTENRVAAQGAQAAVPKLQQVIAQNRSAAATDSPSSMPQPTIAPNESSLSSDYLGLLSIPTLSLELPIFSEWSEDALKSAPCRQSGSIEADNLVIAGHNYADHFGRLKSLVVGDSLTLTALSGEAVTYTVNSIETLSPTQVDDVLNSDSALTLYTCTYSGQERIVVRCVRLSN